jgi:hypothetical protein
VSGMKIMEGPLRAEICRRDIVLIKWYFTNSICVHSSVFICKIIFQLLVNYDTCFENSVLSRISRLMEEEVGEERKISIMRSFTISTHKQLLLL